MDISSLFSVSHLVTFLGGAFVGCVGQYLADRFTDQRRKMEHKSEAEKEFLTIKADMKELIAAMGNDLTSDDSRSVREFVVVPNKSVSFKGNKPRFMYYEDEHLHLRLQVDRLRYAGYVDDITSGNAPIFRMREHFVSLVKANA